MRFGRVLGLLPLLLALALPACESPRRVAESQGRAVVVYARDRTDDAAYARSRLQAVGFEVDTQVEGPLSRETSSAAVYGLRDAPDRAAVVKSALEGLPDIEMLPFAQPGPGDTDVVVWLVATVPEDELEPEDAPEPLTPDEPAE